MLSGFTKTFQTQVKNDSCLNGSYYSRNIKASEIYPLFSYVNIQWQENYCILSKWFIKKILDAPYRVFIISKKVGIQILIILLI